MPERGVPAQSCADCRSRWFPDRLLCPRCGSEQLGRIVVEHATVLDVTERPGEPALVATLGEDELRFVARVPIGTRSGDVVLLSTSDDDDGSAWVPSLAP